MAVIEAVLESRLRDLEAAARAYRDAWRANLAVPSDASGDASNRAHNAVQRAREALFNLVRMADD